MASIRSRAKPARIEVGPAEASAQPRLTIADHSGPSRTTRDHPRRPGNNGPLLTTSSLMTGANSMVSVAEVARSPRFGSAAELASYAGLSVKTIRRLVDAGKVRGRKVGRRLVIPFEDLDAHILETMPATRPQSTFDARGRALPLAADEERRRAAEAILALDRLDEMGDEDEQRATLQGLMVNLDEDRSSDRRRSC
jgi:excisionase family DNA binding protein